MRRIGCQAFEQGSGLGLCLGPAPGACIGARQVESGLMQIGVDRQCLRQPDHRAVDPSTLEINHCQIGDDDGIASLGAPGGVQRAFGLVELSCRHLTRCEPKERIGRGQTSARRLEMRPSRVAASLFGQQIPEPQMCLRILRILDENPFERRHKLCAVELA